MGAGGSGGVAEMTWRMSGAKPFDLRKILEPENQKEARDRQNLRLLTTTGAVPLMTS